MKEYGSKMRKICIILIAFVLSSISYSQTKNPVYNFLVVDEIPKFDGNVSEYLTTTAYSILPRFFSGDDEVIASFVVDEEGNVCDIKAIKYNLEICKDAVIKALSSMPKWKPGIYKGERVNVRLYVTVTFRII